MAKLDADEAKSTEQQSPSEKTPAGLLFGAAPNVKGERDATTIRSLSDRSDESSHPEQQYLSLLKAILSQGQPRADRTGTGTLSVFAPQPFRFSLADNVLPLLTTKRVPLRIVFEELMWFLRGQTDSAILSAKGVKIWDGNGSRDALDKLGLHHRRVGDLGPVYGFQWRHFGAEYKGCDYDYSGEGVDQLKAVVKAIVENPMDRRIIMSAWNPADLKHMALPPCHMFCQFYISTPTSAEPTPTLSCQLYQRSADVGLGVPFNIASYALLTIMMAHVTGLRPGEFVHVLGDAHIYNDHVEALKVQLQREPKPFPKIYVKETRREGGKQRSVDEMVEDLVGFEFDRFELVGYEPHGKIDMKMSV